MQKIRVLAFVFVLGVLVASPTFAATDAEPLSPTTLFYLEDDGSVGLNDTVNETTKGEAATGKSSFQDPENEYATDGKKRVNETDSAAEKSHATETTDAAGNASAGLADGFVTIETAQVFGPEPDSSPAKESSGDSEPSQEKSPGQGSQQGSSDLSVIFIEQDDMEQLFDFSIPFPGEITLPSMVAEKFHSHIGDAIYEPTGTINSIVERPSSGHSFTSDDESLPASEPRGPVGPPAHPGPMTGSVVLFGHNDHAPQDMALHPSDFDRPDERRTPDPMEPSNVDTWGAHPQELPSGSLPLVIVGILAGLTLLALRAEHLLLKPLQLLWLRLFSRINKDAVLENKTRERIFTMIQQNPGIHAREIAEVFELPHNTVRHHIGILDRHEKVVTFREGKRIFIYPADLASTPDRLRHLGTVPNPLDQAIMQFLQGSSGATQAEIASGLGIQVAQACRRVNVLVEKGVFAVDKNTPDGQFRYNLAKESPCRGFFPAADLLKGTKKPTRS